MSVVRASADTVEGSSAMTSNDHRAARRAAAGIGFGCGAIFLAAVVQSANPVRTLGTTAGSFALGFLLGIVLLAVVARIEVLRSLWMRPVAPVMVVGSAVVVSTASGAGGPDSEFAIFCLMGFAIAVLARTRRLSSVSESRDR